MRMEVKFRFRISSVRRKETLRKLQRQPTARHRQEHRGRPLAAADEKVAPLKIDRSTRPLRPAQKLSPWGIHV